MKRRDQPPPYSQRERPNPRDPDTVVPDADARVRVGNGHRRVPIRYDDESEDPQEFGRWPQTWGER